ncbi:MULTISPECIES: hypothetical protein [Streptomyces]|uniref:Resolvase/invertase-type recombinase catalytic domain-containing protein n=1 Tax=Streptomyces canarius TaxID=285453 RepID=A0ABQ3CJ43_9ACTN|nr:hypothetical protein [Streptomyces canarius]GHA09309.1 hypothetical protein GCM10010345_12230 [Streptomyces canarius]
MSTPLRTDVRAARLEALRREYMGQIVAIAARQGRPLRVAPYALAQPGAEQHADLEQIAEYATARGWKVTSSTFADMSQPLPLTQRPGFGAACRYAAQGFADGILAIARPAITTDNETYSLVLEHLHDRDVFLAYLPTVDAPTTP